MAKAVFFKNKISGTISDTANHPLKQIRVLALKKGSDGSEESIGEAVSDDQGKYQIIIKSETSSLNPPLPNQPKEKPNVFFRIIAGEKILEEIKVTENLEPETKIDLVVDDPLLPNIKNLMEVKGRVFLANKLEAANLELKLYKYGFSSDTLIDSIKTNKQGYYSFRFSHDASSLSYILKAVDPSGKEVPLMKHAHTNERLIVMNLVAPPEFASTESEYHRLMASLSPVLQGKRLGEALENKNTHDLSFLHQETAWDSRLIGLAAMADKRSAETNIAPEFLYALFRTGLPTNTSQLARVSEKGIEKAVSKANEAGIVKQDVAQAKAMFKAFSEKSLLESKTAGGLASVNDFLKRVALPAEEEKKLSHLYFNEKLEGQEFWDKAKSEGVSDSSIGKLQIQGKLSFLTGNNPELSDQLNQSINGTGQLSALAEKGFYKADSWKKTIKGMAGDSAEKMAALIPTTYQGQEVTERLDAYAEDMARKIRAAYPTHTLSAMIGQGDMTLGKKHQEVKEHASLILSNAASIKLANGESYVPGSVSLQAFVAEHKKELLNGIPDAKAGEALDSLKTITRLYQVSPTDEAMQVLYDHGFTSALEISAIPYNKWMKQYAPKFKTKQEAIVVYQKAEQCKTMVYNFYTAVEQINSGIELPVTSSNAEEKETVKNEMIKKFPTLETLFGSMDFCQCDHCRSVLSPAAYLVDILKFLDPNEEAWERSKQLWKLTHNGTDYSGSTPFEVFKERRADIPQIPLNCENTNQALPYIDIVNEILECYVARQDMETLSYDSSEHSSQELIAEPQHVLPAAYQKLQEAVYPLQLPFDYPLELSRKLSDYFGIPFWKLLHDFKKTNELFEGGSTAPYYLNDVFMEYLGLSAAEYNLLSKPDFSAWFSLYGYTAEEDALTIAIDADTKNRIDLLSAKTFSRKLGIRYKELVELVKTSFLNPSLDELVLLRTLKIETSDVFRWKAATGYTPLNSQEKADFEAALAAKSSPEFDATAWLNKFWDDNLFAKIIVLHDTDAGGNFDQTTLKFADGTSLSALDWVKLNVFVRLWKKLGWRIEDLDYALCTFVPSDTALTATDFEQKMKTALIYLAHVKKLQEQWGLGKTGLHKWISLWGRFDQGISSLYSQYFLAEAFKKDNPVYEHPLGKHLQYQDTDAFLPYGWDAAKPENAEAGNVSLHTHLSSVQAALGFTETEIKKILSRNGRPLSTAALNMETIKLLHGYSVLREATKLSISDLLDMQTLSGLKPLKALHTTPITTLSEDSPYTQLIPFLELAGKIKAAGFSISDLNYLLRHHFDATGPDATPEKELIGFIRRLSMEMKRIKLEQAPPLDATGYHDDFLRERLVLALSPDVAATFMEMWNDTIVVSASLPAAPANKLPDDLLPEHPKLSYRYDAVREAQHMMFTGVLDDIQMVELEARLLALELLPDNNITAEQRTLATELLHLIQQESQLFWEQHIFKPVCKENASQAFSTFFPMADPSLSPRQQLAMKQDKQESIGRATLAYLESRLLQAAVIAAIAEAFDLEQPMAKFLLTHKKLLTLNDRTLLDLYLRANDQGLTIRFMKNEGSGEESGPSIKRENLHLKASDVPPETSMVVVEGYMESQVAGAFRFYLQGSKAGTQLELSFQHLNLPLLEQTLANDQEEVSEFMQMEAGTMYRYTLKIRDLGGGELRWRVQSDSIPKTEINALQLIPLNLAESVRQAHILLKKATNIINKYELEEKELSYLCGHPGHYYQMDIKDLPVQELNPAVNQEKQRIEKLLNQLLSLAEYHTHKKEMVGGRMDLIDMLESIRDDQSATLELLIQQFALHTRRDLQGTQQLVAYFGFKPSSFSKGDGLKRLWDTLKTIHTLGISMVSVTAVAQLVSGKASFDVRFAAATAFKNSIKSIYTNDNWLRVAQTVYDALRPLQRDALCAYVMHQEKFSNQGQLFEYFLIDPGMEPVVQTSRIRLAISSVQTFVQRCLLNLEPGVSPSVIDRNQWEWMKRYRVWEANRKIFLFPENWLEPEFRDDKTHLYQELESSVMQGDVNQELVEKAFFHYLKGLEKISRLNMVAMYCEQDSLTLSNNTIHVIGKSYTQPSYFYRSYRNNMWSPWVPIPDQIEGEHLALIKWQDRMHLFWLTFLPKSESRYSRNEKIEGAAKKNTNELMKHIVEIQLNWCEYVDGEWRARESGGFENALVSEVTASFNAARVYVHASVEYNDGVEKAVRIHVKGENIAHAFRLVSKLAHPTSAAAFYQNPSEPPFIFSRKGKTKYWSNGDFKVSYNKSITTIETNVDGKKTTQIKKQAVNKALLRNTKGTSFLFCNDAIQVSGDSEIDNLISPFFFEDNEDSITLFVEPEVKEKTVETWEKWIIKEEISNPIFENEDYWRGIPVMEAVPLDKWWEFEKVIDFEHNPYVIPVEELIQPRQDWVTNPNTVIEYDMGYVGLGGGLVLEHIENGQMANGLPGLQKGKVVEVDSGSGIAKENVMVTENTISSDTLTHQPARHGDSTTVVNIVGEQGVSGTFLGKLNPGLKFQFMDTFKGTGF